MSYHQEFFFNSLVVEHPHGKFSQIPNIDKPCRSGRVEGTSPPNMIEKSIGAYLPETATKD
ncbi:MAG: hypothetical protein HWD63_06420 [Candidatus Parvibacillus calidus]|nr:MAG: hypothetical protein HWD63_06420 [Candidatus Parvibacillus calidus]